MRSYLKTILFWLISIMNMILPKNQKKIFIEDIPGIYDNQTVMFEYLIKNKYNQRYKIFYFSGKKMLEYYGRIPNVFFIGSTWNGIIAKCTSKYVFYAFGANRFDCRVPKGQIVVNLWHGYPMKKIGNMVTNRGRQAYDIGDTFTYILAGSDFFAPIMRESFNCTDEKIYIGGNPRNDLLFMKGQFLNHLRINKAQYSKIVAYLPTFRNSIKINDGFNYGKDFPIIDESNVYDLDRFLNDLNCLLIFKAHSGQSVGNFFDNTGFSNIKVFYNHDLENSDVHLYNFLTETDALITDYSGVYFDYLLLNKPIAFAIDDIDEYRGERGFVVEDPTVLMAGKKMYTMADLKDFISNVCEDMDPYKKEREEANNTFNAMRNSGNCDGILNKIGLF